MRRAGLWMLGCGLVVLLALPGVSFAGIVTGLTVVGDERAIESDSFVQSLYGISEEIEIRTPEGSFFDESVLTDAAIGLSQGNGGASQTSNLTLSSFSGSGATDSFATVPAFVFDLIEISGASIFDVTFNVAAAALYDITGSLMTSLAGNGSAGAGFLLSVVSGATLSSTFVMGGEDAVLSDQVMLMPGVMYRLVVQGSSNAFEGGNASASWNFNLAANAPEPAALALLTLGLVGFAVSRRTLR